MTLLGGHTAAFIFGGNCRAGGGGNREQVGFSSAVALLQDENALPVETNS